MKELSFRKLDTIVNQIINFSKDYYFFTKGANAGNIMLSAQIILWKLARFRGFSEAFNWLSACYSN